MDTFFQSWFNRFFILYLAAYLMPAVWFGGFDTSGENLMWGWECAFLAFVYMFMIPFVFVGNLSNVLIIIISILHYRKSSWLQRRDRVIKYLLLVLMASSLITWSIMMGGFTLFHVGYYVWAVGCLGMAAVHLFGEQFYAKEKTELDISEHLVD